MSRSARTAPQALRLKYAGSSDLAPGRHAQLRQVRGVDRGRCDGGKLEKVTFDGNNGKVDLIKQGYPDGPVAVTVVGYHGLCLRRPAVIDDAAPRVIGAGGRPEAVPGDGG
ncbi:MAG: hypothetical protein WDM77_14965 [Steroidobacteraceae bacterium]